MIIEDEGLVAQTLVDLVNDAGFLALGPVATAAEAVGALDLWHPHAAILDFVLRDETATRVAIELTSRGIPFVVYTGLARGGVSLPDLARLRWHEKPGSGEELISRLRSWYAKMFCRTRGRQMRLGRRPPRRTRRCENLIDVVACTAKQIGYIGP